MAKYWHDYRGDEHGIEFAIEFANGIKELWPVGRMVDFLEGGGRDGYVLSAKAITYIDGKLNLDPTIN